MPTLPVEMFNNIPDFLKRISEVATTKEERDILLLGSLVTQSVAFPKITGKYGDNPVNANLYLFISAKASAGKGILIHCRKLIDPIHLSIRQQAKLMKQKYEVDSKNTTQTRVKTTRWQNHKHRRKKCYLFQPIIVLRASLNY